MFTWIWIGIDTLNGFVYFGASQTLLVARTEEYWTDGLEDLAGQIQLLIRLVDVSVHSFYDVGSTFRSEGD